MMKVSEKKKVEVHNFETLRQNLTDNNMDILLDNSCEPDLNVFKTNVQSLNTSYFLTGEFHNNINHF